MKVAGGIDEGPIGFKKSIAGRAENLPAIFYRGLF